MAAHPLRWQLLAELAGSDRRVRELTARVGQPQNLVSYHLRLLRSSGLVASRRSDFDARDAYYRLDLDRCGAALTATGATLHPALAPGPAPAPAIGARGRLRVLFACTGNSARSPIAEALLRHQQPPTATIEVTSAGSRPQPRIHPHAVRVLRDGFGLEVDHRPRHLHTLTGQRFDFVITLCDKLREVCPDFAGARTTHWSIPDPAAEQQSYAAVSRAAAEIASRIRHLLPVLAAAHTSEVSDDHA